MGFSRYTFSENRKDINNKNYVSSSKASYRIYKGVEAGIIKYNTRILEEGERLDQIAGAVYKDSSYWWVIAAASGIGYALQVPPGVVLRIPSNLSDVLGVLSWVNLIRYLTTQLNMKIF